MYILYFLESSYSLQELHIMQTKAFFGLNSANRFLGFTYGGFKRLGRMATSNSTTRRCIQAIHNYQSCQVISRQKPDLSCCSLPTTATTDIRAKPPKNLVDTGRLSQYTLVPFSSLVSVQLATLKGGLGGWRIPSPRRHRITSGCV